MSAAGVRTVNLPISTTPVELLGHHYVGSVLRTVRVPVGAAGGGGGSGSSSEFVEAVAALSVKLADADAIQVDPRDRPGDARYFFGASISGDGAAIAPIAAGASVVGDRGSVLRVPSTGEPVIVSSRKNFAIEAGQVYAARFALLRTQNTSDPLGDNVECRLALLDKDKAYLGTVLIDGRSLTTFDGRLAVSKSFSLDQVADVTVAASTVYVRPYVRLLGGNGITDIEVIDVYRTTGLPGPKGNTGDVTPTAQTARDQAVAAAAQIVGVITDNPAGSTAGSYPKLLTAEVAASPSGQTPGVSSAMIVAAPSKVSGAGYNFSGDGSAELTLAGGTFTAPAKLKIQSLGIASAAVQAGGTGWTVGDQFFFNSSAGTFFVQGKGKVTAVSGGAVTGVSIVESGDYSTALAAMAAVGIAPATGTGLVLNTISYGPNSVTIADPGNYSALPSNPVSVTGGGGSGAQFAVKSNVQGLRSAALNPRGIVARTTYGRAAAVGVDRYVEVGGVTRNVAHELYNDPSEVGPYGYAIGDDSSVAFTATNFTINSSNAQRLPPNNPLKLLNEARFDFNRDVPDIVGGSQLFSIGFGFRSKHIATGVSAAFVDTYAAKINGVAVDPDDTNPKGALYFLTAAPANVAGGVLFKAAIGQGLWTANADGTPSLPGGDMGVGTINAAKIHVGGVKIADFNGSVAALYGTSLQSPAGASLLLKSQTTIYQFGGQTDADPALVTFTNGGFATRSGLNGNPTWMQRKRRALNKTAAFILTSADTDTTYSNVGSSAQVNYQLPSFAAAGPGAVVRFANLAASGSLIAPAAGNNIRMGAASSSVSFSTTGIGATLELESLGDGSTWIVLSSSGTWNAG